MHFRIDSIDSWHQTWLLRIGSITNTIQYAADRRAGDCPGSTRERVAAIAIGCPIERHLRLQSWLCHCIDAEGIFSQHCHQTKEAVKLLSHNPCMRMIVSTLKHLDSEGHQSLQKSKCGPGHLTREASAYCVVFRSLFILVLTRELRSASKMALLTNGLLDAYFVMLPAHCQW